MMIKYAHFLIYFEAMITVALYELLQKSAITN